MPAAPNDYFTLVEAFELKAPVEKVQPVIAGVLKRLEVEGVEGLVSMQFYTSGTPGEMGAVIRFSDRKNLRAHMDMVGSWDEFRSFAAMIRLVEIRVFGILDDPAVEAWMRQFDGPIKKFDRFAAGFARPDA